ncbi:hypothetical protein T484DRAFT_1874880, partial [Baffinella frigidus]
MKLSWSWACKQASQEGGAGGVRALGVKERGVKALGVRVLELGGALGRLSSAVEGAGSKREWAQRLMAGSVEYNPGWDEEDGCPGGSWGTPFLWETAGCEGEWRASVNAASRVGELALAVYALADRATALVKGLVRHRLRGMKGARIRVSVWTIDSKAFQWFPCTVRDWRVPDPHLFSPQPSGE